MAKRKELRFQREEENFLAAIQDIRDDPKLVEEFIIAAGSDYFPMIPNGEHKFSILRRIYQNAFNGDPNKGHHLVQITDKEIEFLKGLPTDLIKRLFYSLIVRSKVKPHKTGWISLDFENTIYYALKDAEARKAKIEIYSQCTEYGFETLVIGSTHPVLCYKIPVVGEGEPVIEFKDGEARERFREVIGFDTDR